MAKRKWQVFEMYRGSSRCKILAEFGTPEEAEDYFAEHQDEYEPTSNSYMAIDSEEIYP
jgi:hypothetical protein